MTSRAFTGILAPAPSRDLESAREALADLGPTVRTTIASASQQQLSGAWSEELTAKPGYNAQQRAIVAASPSTIAYDGGMAVATGGSSKLGWLTREFEFGSLNRERFTTYTRRSPKGKTHQVKRRAERQIPPRSQTGWLAYPAAGRWSARAFSMYLQIVVKAFNDAIEGKR